MPVVKGRHQSDAFGTEHAVAKHVAWHVATADNAHRFGLHVHAHFQEMALHADPGPPGSDSHFLVVIAMAAAAREGIAQPEVLLQRNGIGEIGKARRPLVRRNDEIRVSAVMNSHTLRLHDLAIGYIVSDRKQRPNEYLITYLPLGDPGIHKSE